MFRGAIFDMDGVLVDNMKVHMEAFATIARRYGVAIDTDEVMGMAGRGNGEIFGRIFPAEIIERVGTHGLADEKEALYRQIYAPRLAPVRGLVKFLTDLRAHGVKIAVGTSGSAANLAMVLDGAAIRPFFDVLVTADMVTRTKPDPEIYLRAVAELGLRADECFVFEDAIAGIRAAQAAGIKAIALATTFDRATLASTPNVEAVVDDFTEIDYDRLNVLT